jgi:5,10-methylenetetrahydromethanopterin reductase
METVTLAALAEESGLEFAWLADQSPAPPFRDIFVAMSAIALNTESIKIGSAINNPYTRHPAMMATAMATLNEMAPGRIITGLGAGGSLPLTPLNIKKWEMPLTAIREAFKILRGMYAGESVNFKGKILRATNCKLERKVDIPIFLAARGPKMLELVGELSDGAILDCPLQYIDFALERIKAGCERSGRDMRMIEIANWIPFSMMRDRDKARELVKFYVSFRVADSPPLVHEKVGLTSKEVAEVRNGLKADISSAIKKVAPKMIDAFSISGTPSECVEKIEKFVDAGVKQIIFASPFGSNPKEVIKQIGDEIIPSF